MKSVFPILCCAFAFGCTNPPDCTNNPEGDKWAGEIWVNPKDWTAWRWDGSGWVQLTTRQKSRVWTKYENGRWDRPDHSVWEDTSELFNPDNVPSEYYLYSADDAGYVMMDDRGRPYVRYKIAGKTYRVYLAEDYP